MDDKTSLHTDDPFNPAAEAANAPEAAVTSTPETPRDEVMTALEGLAAFAEDPVQPIEGACAAIEAADNVRLPTGMESEAAASDMAEHVPDLANEPVVDAAPKSLEPAEPHEPLVARPEAPWAIPTHAEHRDGPPLAASDDEPADEPFDTIEDGIASIFARLHAETREAHDEEHEDEITEADDAVTFQLLGELDRLWHRAER